MGEDLLFNLEYAKQADSVVTISDSLYVYDKTNVASLTHKYKDIYYEQNLCLFRQWLNWFNEYKSANDVWVHYRIVSLYFKKLFYTCSQRISVKKLDMVRSMFSSDVVISIQRSRHLFDRSHRLVLQLIVKKRYRLLLIVGTVYCRLKPILQGRREQ